MMNQNILIPRAVQLENIIEKNKVVIIYGPRQVGKTTLIKQFLRITDLKYKLFSGDQLDFADNFAKCELELIKNIIGNSELLVIDEAQKIANIGRALKLVVDQIPNIYVIATGSSSFDIANLTDEPLTGRKNVVTLYPIAIAELAKIHTKYELQQRLTEDLVYGTYPNIITYQTQLQKQNRIVEIKDAYLIKDILEFYGIKKSQMIINLLKLLAFQLGNEVSTTELGNTLKLDHKTVMRYLELLEKSFVIFRLNGFARNLRKEVNKMGKYYFYDLGIRNALIANFNDISLRNDIGQLWENFVIVERIKNNIFAGIPKNYYFWRTYDQKEIDFIEEYGGKLDAYEFKWQKDKKSKPPQDWITTYPTATYQIITPNNYLDFITAESNDNL